MAKVFLRGRVWWCWGYDVNGKRWQESTHQREKRAAELAAREIERRYAASPDYARRTKLTLERALLALLESLEKQGKTPATIRAAEYHARHLVTVLKPETPLSNITLADTTAYVETRLGQVRTSRHTVAKELRTLTQAMKRCAKLGVFVPQVDPHHLMPDELGKVYTPRKRWLPRAEYDALLKAIGDTFATKKGADEDRRDYVIAYCTAGLRKSELFDVRPEHYDAERKTLFVDGTKTDESARLVPLGTEANEVFERRCKRDVPFPVWHTVTRDLARACSRAGIAPVTPNDLRRTFCSWLCQAGVPERVCAELMGHASTTMVRAVYGHLDRRDEHGRTIKMHREIMGAPDGVEVDHRDGDSLNNRRSNLRLATRQQNACNVRSARMCKSSQYKGVCWCAPKSAWRATIVVNKKQRHLGMFEDEAAAARAYDAAAQELHGDFARLNFPEAA